MVLAVPTPTTRAAGTRLTGAIWQSDVTDTVTFLLNPPQFQGYQNAVQSIPNATWTALSLDAERFDDYNGHSTSVNPSRWTVPTGAAGRYTAAGVYASALNATGFRAARIQVNGSPVLGGGAYAPNASGSIEMGVVTPIVELSLAVGDYVEVAGYQSSGGALNTILDVDLRCALWLRFSHA